MTIAMVGLGKMGANMARRLMNGGHNVLAFDLNKDAVREIEGDGAQGVANLADLKDALVAPRVVWVMVPAGGPTEATITELARILDAGDVIVDGGNSFYKDSVRRAATVRESGVHFVDAGTSGGVWGITEGYSLMVGGDDAGIAAVKPALETLAPAPDRGWGHVGPAGSGHYVKMVHNGIEYGLMQAYGEGFELLRKKEEFGLDLNQITGIWQHGSVVRSWLLDLISRALGDNPNLDGIAAYVTDSGEGRWTVAEAIDLNIAIPVISMALQRRFRSRDEAPFSDKLLAAMRQQFGGHAVKKSE
jgi:6-phosphogluconate dehydrogenase